MPEPTQLEVIELLRYVEGSLQDCFEEITEDPGCVDPDRTMVPFEDLQGATTRLFTALGMR